MKLKNVFSIILVFLIAVSCVGVDPGHKGVKVEWGGKTDMSKIYNEGMHIALSWMWNDMIKYDVREKTITHKFEFNDKNNMKTPVEISIDYRLQPDKVNTIHSAIGQDQLDVKIITTLSSAAKQVVPQYSATELNLNKREEAETKLTEILKAEFPAFYVDCSRVRITDVDIPQEIAIAAEANARQEELNKLSEKRVIESKNNLAAAQFDAEAKKILSQPQMIELRKLEVEEIWAKKGVSPYGTNNVFGSDLTVVKGLK